jgi:hypothetical protein
MMNAHRIIHFPLSFSLSIESIKIMHNAIIIPAPFAYIALAILAIICYSAIIIPIIRPRIIRIRHSITRRNSHECAYCSR